MSAEIIRSRTRSGRRRRRLATAVVATALVGGGLGVATGTGFAAGDGSFTLRVEATGWIINSEDPDNPVRCDIDEDAEKTISFDMPEHDRYVFGRFSCESPTEGEGSVDGRWEIAGHPTPESAPDHLAITGYMGFSGADDTAPGTAVTSWGFVDAPSYEVSEEQRAAARLPLFPGESFESGPVLLPLVFGDSSSGSLSVRVSVS